MTDPLIPRANLFGNPSEAGSQISPDGRWLSWLAPVDGVLNVWVASIKDRASALPVTRDRSRGIRNHLWTHLPGCLLYLQDVAGDENFHVFAVDVFDHTNRDLTPVNGVAARIVRRSRDVPGHILLGINDRDRRYHDLVRVDLLTGERTRIQENRGFSYFLADDALRVHLAVRPETDGSQTVLRLRNDVWEQLFRFGAEDAWSSGPTTLDRAGDAVYCRDSRGRDMTALTRVDLSTGAIEVVVEPEESGVGVMLADLVTKDPQVCVFYRERPRYVAIDKRLQPDLDFLASQGLATWGVTSRTANDTAWIVAASSDTQPPATYLYDRISRSFELLHRAWPKLDEAPLATMRPVTLRSRDGLDLVSYLTRPRQHDPSAPGPMVLMVHGGPWARDLFGFNLTHQWLANRGYGVLSVNFRGSTGFGKAFVNAGDGEWGRRMDDDLLDAVAWSIEAKIADPKRIAIMGGSYGGYATLAALTRNPEVYACGVDVVGPANLETLMRSTPAYWETLKPQLFKAIGDPDTEAGLALARERSPVLVADRIRRPLLIAQGANDPRVKRAESDQMVDAMRANGIPVTYLLFPDEGHGFARPENNIAFHAVAEAFLVRHLGGRCEAIQLGEHAASSMQVLDGDLIDFSAVRP